MMTTTEAKKLRQAHDDDARKLTRMRKAELVNIRRAELRAEGVEWVGGGPGSKDELVNDILNRRYPIEHMNESIHVLYHAPSTRWDGCEHCQAVPDTLTLDTGQLVPGDVVRIGEMRVRVDTIRRYVPVGQLQAAFCCPGTVLNAADMVQWGIPRSLLQTWRYDEKQGATVVDREDAWTLQGDQRAHWIVELPRPSVEFIHVQPSPGMRAAVLAAAELPDEAGR